MRRGQKNTRDYQIRGTPAMVVAGKYRVTSDAPGVTGYDSMLDIVDYLIELEKPAVAEAAPEPAEETESETVVAAES